jgi:hypothetical protein
MLAMLIGQNLYSDYYHEGEPSKETLISTIKSQNDELINTDLMNEGQENEENLEKLELARSISNRISEANLLKHIPSSQLDVQHVLSSLILLLDDRTLPVLTKIEGSSADDRIYFINFGRIYDFMKWYYVECILSERYGERSGRIFRLLRQLGRLSEKQIVEKTMMPVKEVRSRLGMLMSDRWLHLHEIPKTADRDPGRNIYLWHVHEGHLMWTMKSFLLKGLVNLRERKETERLLHQTVLDKVEKNRDPSYEVQLTMEEQAQLAKWTHARDRLELAELRLSHLHCLFTFLQ